MLCTKVWFWGKKLGDGIVMLTDFNIAADHLWVESKICAKQWISHDFGC